MKSIRISFIYRHNNQHCIWLGNGHKHNFSNKQEAQAYLNSTSKFLNQKLFDLTECWKWLFITYTDKQFYFVHGTGTDKYFTGDNTKAKQIVMTLVEQFDRTIRLAPRENGCYNSFLGLMRITANQQELLKIIQATVALRSDTQAKHMCESWYSRLNMIRNELNDYGSASSVEFNKNILADDDASNIILIDRKIA